MPKKSSIALNSKTLLEMTTRDSLDNLEEFTRMMVNNIDFNTFDIISITRTDADDLYTQQFACRKVTTQAYRIAADAKNIIQLPSRRQKLN